MKKLGVKVANKIISLLCCEFAEGNYYYLFISHLNFGLLILDSN